MKILLLLGQNGKYLTYKKFDTDFELDEFIEKIGPLMMANIDKALPLRERLKLLPSDVEYFIYAGAVIDFKVIEE